MTSTSAKRFELMDRGELITFMANEKLRLPQNAEKGDNWDDYSLRDLQDLLSIEVNELVEVMYMLQHYTLEDQTKDMLGEGLLKEAADIENVLRFICSKYGAI